MKNLVAIAVAVALVAPVAMADNSWIQTWGDSANLALADAGSDLRIHSAEVLVEGNEVGTTFFFANVGNKQLTADFVPNDPRRTWSQPNSLTYLVDLSDGNTASGLSAAQTDAAIDSAMATWDFDTNCSNLPIPEVADPGDDPDLIDALLGFGPPPGPGFPYADVVHGGWTTAFAPPTLGVTFTFVFTGTDINNDGKADAAFREIYYSDLFNWQIGANIDVETVALHEAGHGLSQGHFGKLHQTNNGKFHFSPLSVMNAGYTQVQQSLAATDLAGHCSIYGGWPNN
ncbi:MAG TPA: hypothetical protein VKU40_06455 [Thermoanaerobaculia bacterium]|nr:hypothetical protein [Thermoanaerobaculia bacterium]